MLQCKRLGRFHFYELRTFYWEISAIKRRSPGLSFPFFAPFAFFAVRTYFLFEIVHPSAVVPQIFSFRLVGKGEFEKGIDGVGIFDVEVRIVCGEHHIVFETVLGNVFGRDLIAFHGAVALALKIFQRRQREIGIFRFARGLGIFSHAPEQPRHPGAVAFQESHF